MTTTEHVDVIVVGAGISGISAGYHLQTMCPGRSFAILERRPRLGGTWDLFRYPGVRSDSDMHTLGFRFKPWTDPKSIADGPSILRYLEETASEFGIDRHIRFDHGVSSARWSSTEARWTLGIDDAGTVRTMTCDYLFMCAGYYRYQAGHTPDFDGADDFTGQVVHPQHWPADLDHRDKRVVVIGSGATAMTLVPALARDAAHVTMLQRSPTYVVAAPDHDVVANALRRLLPDRLAYGLTRRKNAWVSEFTYRRTRTDPEQVKRWLLSKTRKALGHDFDVETHFTPDYDPWDQRLCLVPNGDLFDSITSGAASVVTDHIDRFTSTGVALRSGEHLEADIIVTATGLELVTLGEVDFFVDDEPVDFSQTFTYKGISYSDVPNLASTFGYINASWTLRADLISEHVCRVLNHLEETGTSIAVPRLRESETHMPARPWVDDFSAGYIQRVLPLLPKQGDREPWLNTQSHRADRKLIGEAPIDDGVLRFERAAESALTS